MSDSAVAPGASGSVSVESVSGVLEQHARARRRSRPPRRPAPASSARASRSSAANGAAQSRERARRQRLFDGLLAHHDGVGEADAVGRQHARQRMDEHAAHAERIRDQAGVLAGRAAEAGERVLGDVVAALHGDLLDGIGHVLDGDANAARRERGRRRAVCVRQRRAAQRVELSRDDCGVERLIAVRDRTAPGRSPAGCGLTRRCSR